MSRRLYTGRFRPPPRHRSVSPVDRKPTTRLLGEHFRADGRPKRAWPDKVKAETGIARDQHAYQCSMCHKWHRATTS